MSEETRRAPAAFTLTDAAGVATAQGQAEAVIDDDGVSAQLRYADLEREPGARGVLVENDRDAAGPVERPTGDGSSSR